MVLSLFRKSVATEHVYAVYSAIVAQSRQPRFYADWGVPDTVTGRFNMISVHMALLLRRLRDEPAAKNFVQALVDRFFKDMDQSHRELGVTDLGVPRQIRRLGNLFYGLAQSLGEALDQNSTAAVEAVLVRNLYSAAPSAHAADLAAYVVNEAARLALEPTASILAGSLDGAAA